MRILRTTLLGLLALGLLGVQGSAMAGVVTPYTSDANTVFLYHLDESSGTSATDSSSNGLDLTSTTTPFEGVSGPAGLSTAGTFDTAVKGLNRNLGATEAALFNLQTFTVEAWVRNPAAGGQRGIMQLRGAGRISLRLNNLNQLQLSIIGDGFKAISTTSAVTFDTDEWYHVAVTYAGDGAGDDSEVKFYQTPLSDMSGVATLLETKTGINDVDPLGTPALRIGTLDAASAWGGDIDEARFTNLTLGAGDFNLAVIPEPSSLLLTGLGMIGLIGFARRRKK